MTPYGQFDTVVWASQRDGSKRVNRVWHAPQLGYVPVQAIQYNKGRPDVQLKLVALDRRRQSVSREAGTCGRQRSREWPTAGSACRSLSPERRQAFGSVTPFCPWYLPPRSLYEVSQTSSDSKNSICATPSLA